MTFVFAVTSGIGFASVNIGDVTLTRRGTVLLPANVHYAWPHVSRRFLYVASSDSASGIGGVVGHRHHVSAFRIDPGSGALTPHGEAIALPTRPIHMTSDIPSRNLLVAFSKSMVEQWQSLSTLRKSLIRIIVCAAAGLAISQWIPSDDQITVLLEFTAFAFVVTLLLGK